MTVSKRRIGNELWEKIAPLISEQKTSHPQGTHRKCVDDPAAMDAIFFLLVNGCQWNALNETGFVRRVLHTAAFRNGAKRGF